MSINQERYCCVTYRELAPELIQVKTNEIEGLIKEKGLPRSVFASVIRVLNNMTQYCPVCGSGIDAPQVFKDFSAGDKRTDAPRTETVKTVDSAPCRQCGGRGILGKDSNGIVIKCIRCHGSGKMDNSNRITIDQATKDAQSKVADIRTKTGIGDNVVQSKGE